MHFPHAARSFEARIRFLPANLIPDLFQPSYPNLTWAFKLRHIRLDIQQRRAIKRIYPRHIDQVAFQADNLYQRQPNWIGAAWRARGKDATWLSIEERGHNQVGLLYAVEMIKQVDVGEAGQILQASHKFRKDLHDSRRTSITRWLNRHILQAIERAVNNADRPKGYFHVIRG